MNATPVTSPPAAEGSARTRLLVIDDEPGLCSFMAEIASGEGMIVTTCSDPEALDEAMQVNADIIFLDLMMPGTDGIEVLRRAAEAQCTARIVLMSGVDRKVLQTAERYGTARGLQIAGTLQKPARAAEVRTLLRTVAKAAAPSSAPARVRPAAVSVGVDELTEAIERQQLVMHYQPQVTLDGGRWHGIEALVRWNHPRHGLLMPDRFIPLAEESGLSLPLTLAVVRQVLTDCAASRERLCFEGVLSINLPPSALTDVSFPAQLQRMTRLLGCQDVPLRFEITETSAGTDSPVALDILTRLRLAGYTLSIDDFGTGMSSMERLRDLPFNELKVDMQFVRVMADDPDSRAIVEHSIGLAHQLNMIAVAEGVEDERAWHMLAAAGCDVAQGYFVQRPVPTDGLVEWRSRWRAPAAATARA